MGGRWPTLEELRDGLQALSDLPGGAVLLEFVPGGDDLLSSYYALRHDEQELLSFTKRVVRRRPTNEGPATLHEMVDLPATAEAGARFFKAIGLEGLGNVEFKLDRRTDSLKLIECNHRLTAATALVQSSGIDLVGAVYRQADGIAVEEIVGSTDSAQRLMWYPVEDLRSAMRIGPAEVASSLSTAFKRPVLPYWQLTDPAPWLQAIANRVRNRSARLLGRR